MTGAWLSEIGSCYCWGSQKFSSLESKLILGSPVSITWRREWASSWWQVHVQTAHLGHLWCFREGRPWPPLSPSYCTTLTLILSFLQLYSCTLLCALTVHHSLLPWNQRIRGSTLQKYQKTRSEPVLGSIPHWGTDLKLQFPYLLSEEVQTRCSMCPPWALKDLNLAPLEPAPNSPARKHGQFSTPKGLGGQND